MVVVVVELSVVPQTLDLPLVEVLQEITLLPLV